MTGDADVQAEMLLDGLLDEGLAVDEQRRTRLEGRLHELERQHLGQKLGSLTELGTARQ